MAAAGGASVSFDYDALSRKTTETAPQGTMGFVYDAAGRRTAANYPGGSSLSATYTYLVTGELDTISQGATVLADYGYDDLGNRTAAAYGNGASQALGYDPVSRLTSLTVDLSGTTNDLTKTFAYNPASQIVTETRSNTAYSQLLSNSTQTSVTNGLNQLSTVNGTTAAYDSRGNMTTDAVTGKTYSYLKTNGQLSNVPSPFTTYSYDALDRLWSANNGGAMTTYVSDSTDTIAEYDGSNVLQKRYAFDGTGWPLVQYDAAGNRTWMLPDERGSIVALANDSSAMTAINTYDEYGIPGASNAGTFQYAGMMWLGQAALYAPTFRAYAQHLGRFNQTDPLGYAGDGPNLYAYVINDPVNLVDPLGLADVPDIPVNGCTGSQWYLAIHLCVGWGGGGGFSAGASTGGSGEGRAGGEGKGQKQNQCPAGTMQAFRRWASRTADITGNAANVVALAGSVPSPLTPGLEASAAGLKVVSFGASFALLGADAIYAAQSGNKSVFIGDLANFAAGIIPFGGAANWVGRHQPSGPSLSPKAQQVQERATDTAMGFNVTMNMPAPCK